MKKFLAFILTAIMLVSLVGCGDSHNHSGDPEVVLCDMWYVSCHTEKMTQYLEDSVENIFKYATGTSEISKQEAYHFTWEMKKRKNDVVIDYTFVLSRDMVQSEVIYTETTNNTYIDIYNLELSGMYFWTVTAHMEDGSNWESESRDFATSAVAPRVIYVEGVSNCRDLGGWKIEGTERNYVKQGMIFRTGRMNDDKKENVTIKEAGVAVLRDQLGIKTEIDLRQEEVRNESALGSGVKYVNIPMSGNDVYKNLGNLSEGICQVFSILADENNYPIQIHCSVGTDRTGLICFLVNGLLGVSEEELYRDYLFSNFGKVDGMRKLTDITDSFAAVIKEEEGSSLSEKITNYLLKIGVTQTEIDSIRQILIEDR